MSKNRLYLGGRRKQNGGSHPLVIGLGIKLAKR